MAMLIGLTAAVIWKIWRKIAAWANTAVMLPVLINLHYAIPMISKCVIPMMFMGLVLPILVQAWKNNDRETFKRRLQKAFDFSALLALPIVGGAPPTCASIIAGIAITESIINPNTILFIFNFKITII